MIIGVYQYSANLILNVTATSNIVTKVMNKYACVFLRSDKY